MSAPPLLLYSEAAAKSLQQVVKCLAVLVFTMVVGGCGNSAKPPPNLANMRGLAAAKADDPWESKLEKFAEQAVIDAWQRHQIALDFSTNSVQSLERILDTMNRSPQFQSFSEKAINPAIKKVNN